jgi:hypothetical protein
MNKLKYIPLFALLALVACKEESPKDLPKDVAAAPAEEAVPENALLKAKPRSVIGTVDLQKAGKENWVGLRVGRTVIEKDRIRTALESETILELSEGSVLTVSELSDVRLEADLVDNAKKLVAVDIQTGKVHFDIQRQPDREFQFKTGTATAAIRGTAGFVGSVNGQTVASLKEGKVEVSNKAGVTKSVGKNQTLLVDTAGTTKVLQLASSGTEALANAIDSIVKVADGGAAMNTALLEKSINTFDQSYAVRQREFEKRLQFRATGIADTLFVPSVMLQARVTPGTIVTVWGQRDTVPESGIYQRTFTWGDSAYGAKRFLVSCSDGSVELPCYMWVTEYAPMPAPGAAADSVAEPAAEPAKPAANAANAAAEGKNLNLKVSVAGGRNERVHLDLPATEFSTNLKFNLAGITEGDLDQLKSLTVLRNGKPFKTFAAGDLTALAYEVPISIERNRIADFEVVAALKNGKNFRAKKTYEVYCMVANHPGGKARNSIVPPDQEYERLKQSGELKHE